MATTFDATVFDSLSDNVLKSLRLVVLLLRADASLSDLKNLLKISDELNSSSFKDFSDEVIEAYERRYGEVPGLN